MGHARGRLFVPRPRGTTYAEVTAWLSETGSAAPAQRVRDPGRGGRNAPWVQEVQSDGRGAAMATRRRLLQRQYIVYHIYDDTYMWYTSSNLIYFCIISALTACPNMALSS